MVAIALFNGYFVYPHIKKHYRTYHSIVLPKGDPTHFCYIDLELDGKDIGRLDFELFGVSAPKTVNNFLGFVTGDFNPYMRYKNTYLQQIYEQRFITAGDFVNKDGTGTMTVYNEDRMDHEESTLTFDEPYLLAMSADNEGKTGC